MIRQIPVFATLVVLAAVGVMIRLGFWQIDRMHQKETLIASYQAAQQDMRPMVSLPLNQDPAIYLYRRVTVPCSEVRRWQSVSGENRAGEAGIAHVALCTLADRFAFDGPGYDIAVSIGWSRSPANPVWRGGGVTGVIAPFGKGEVKIVADPPLAGLQANAKPDPRDIPNNHFAYAIQWFLFAATALVIYAIALRKRLRGN